MKKRVGVIDIGTDEVTLNIAEKSNNRIKNIDTLVKHINLGQDTFLTGKISYESAEKTAEALLGFKQIMKEYNVSETVAVGTTALREASNRQYIIEQLRIKTGIDINVIDNRREKIQINKLLYAELSNKINTSALLVHLGGGTIGLSLLIDGEITNTMTIFTSALRLNKQFESRGNIDSLYYSDVIIEYLEGYMGEIDKFMTIEPKEFVLTGSNVGLIVDKCGKRGDCDLIQRKDFNLLYKEIKDRTPQQISDIYGIDGETAEVLLPAIVILNRLVKYTSADKLLCPNITIGQAIAYSLLFPRESEAISEKFAKFSIISAKNICKRFQVNEEHAHSVAETALLIFDKLKKYHGLGQSERLLLHLSCLLQNCGKYINIAGHHLHGYNIINGLNIVDIDDTQRRLLALIVLYHNDSPKPSDNLTDEEYVTVSKLSIILRLANSVNKSYGKGFDKTEVILRGNDLTIVLHTYKNIELEKWSFLASAPFFREVYGLNAELKKRSVM
ncbi:MAG: hypothetical protein J6A07_01715 [Firmicutes bacterium]|nr:hypothetical protein [Bacillota bacterium]